MRTGAGPAGNRIGPAGSDQPERSATSRFAGQDGALSRLALATMSARTPPRARFPAVRTGPGEMPLGYDHAVGFAVRTVRPAGRPPVGLGPPRGAGPR